MSDEIRPGELALLERAVIVTKAQMEVASEILRHSEIKGDNIYAAVLQALATNYAASVMKAQ